MINGSDDESEESLHEPLTRREQEILSLLAEGLTGSEMADRLTLAVSSVRWYIQQIYGKLGVNSKRQALTRAGELGLLHPGASNLVKTQGANPSAFGPGPSHPTGTVTFTHPNNLPAQLTSFIGRETEITALRQLITAGPTRMVTLTGSGGVGKTRLAIRLAEELLEDFLDGVWLVELAPLSDPGLVAQETASTLGLPPTPGQTFTQVLCETLRHKHLLLILDNCEHVVSAAAELVNSLLRTCPRLCILATSREILGVGGETPYRCPSLSLPDPDHLPSLPDLSQSEAIRLFTERAQTTSTGFNLTETNAALITQICQRLDGIPLAIELAAARVRLLSIEQIASRLEADFHLLTGGSRTALARHQTLKALIDWSYQLLSEKERLLLMRLSVFAGGWTLEAAEKVCSDLTLAEEEILDLLGQLVDKSLVSIIGDAQGECSRYRMLETIRQYAHEKLLHNLSSEIDEEAAVRQSHLEYILWLAQQAEPHLRGIGQQRWMERLDVELDNIRLALEWALSNDIEKGLQVAAALEWFWHIRNHWVEGINWLECLLSSEAVAAPDDLNGVDTSKVGNQPRSLARSIARGKALNSLAKIKTNWVGTENLFPLLEEAHIIFKEHLDQNQRDFANTLGLLATSEKDLDRAITGIQQALNLLRQAEGDFLFTDYLYYLATQNVVKGDFAQARANANECINRARAAEDAESEGAYLVLLGQVELITGNLQQTELLLRKASSYYEKSGNQLFYFSIMHLLALVAMSHGDYRQACRLSDAVLTFSITMNEKGMLLEAINFLGWEAWALNDYDQAILQCEKGLALARGLRPTLGITAKHNAITAEYILGRAALSKSDYLRADAYFKALILSMEIKNEPIWNVYFSWSPFGSKGVAYEVINALGVLAYAQHDGQRAATLFGAQSEMYDWQKNILSLAERIEYEQALTSTRSALGEKAFSNAWEEGQAMTIEQVVRYALGENQK